MPESVLLHPRTSAALDRPRVVRPGLPSNRTHDALDSQEFVLMERACRPHGGLMRGDELARLLRSREHQPISLLARWIVGREVISFDWQANTLLPLFQFDLASTSVRPVVADVLRELTDVFDDSDLALWFAVPNVWLDDHAPVDVLDRDPRCLLDAARADRFIARGN